MNFSTSRAFFRWQPAAWLRVAGSDAERFLQGQFTNDLRRATENTAVYGLWLNVKGKVVADSFMTRGAKADEFWIGSYFSSATVIRERLESFIIADDVVLEDATDDWRGVTLFGDGAAAICAAKKTAGFIFPGRRAREEHVEWIFPKAADSAPLEHFAGSTELDANDIARRRIHSALPAVPIDVGPGDLPNEGGLEADAISYTKGCYLGQEVMARLKSMGQVRRRLLQVAGGGEEIPALPAALFVGERKVGELRSVAREDTGGFIGLAMLSMLHLEKNAPLAFEPNGAPTVRLLDAP